MVTHPAGEGFHAFRLRNELGKGNSVATSARGVLPKG